MTNNISRKLPPSIHYLAYYDKKQKTILSNEQISKLFNPNQLKKFDTTDLKTNQFIHKHPCAKYFINKLEQWNIAVEKQQDCHQLKSQYLLMEFIYVFLKRVSKMKESQKSQQLKILSAWFKKSEKKNRPKLPTMPNKISSTQSSEVVNSFQTSPNTLIDDFRRKYFNFNSLNKNERYHKNTKQLSKTIRKNLLNYNNNFITSPSAIKQKRKANEDSINGERKEESNSQHFQKVYIKDRRLTYENDSKEQERKYLYEKKINEDVRKNREIQELKSQLEKWKSQKSRLFEEISKNYCAGNFQTYDRISRTSIQKRKFRQSPFQSIKQYRVNTSVGKINTDKSQNKENTVPEIRQVSNLGLIQVSNINKIRKKKSGKKKK